MNKIKGFSWDGIHEKYTWVAQDECGDVYVFTDKPTIDWECGLWNNANSNASYFDCKFIFKEGCGSDINDWQFKCFPREEVIENNPSEFNRENFEAFIQNGREYLRFGILDEFEKFLNSRKQIPQEIKDAIALLEKSGYKISLDKEDSSLYNVVKEVV